MYNVTLNFTLVKGECTYLECTEGPWSDWSTKCGKGSRTRPINVIEKTVERYSCEGLNQNCREEDVEERNELCKSLFISYFIFFFPSVLVEKYCLSVNWMINNDKRFYGITTTLKTKTFAGKGFGQFFSISAEKVSDSVF